MPADVWKELEVAMEELLRVAYAELEAEDEETPFERLRRIHGEALGTPRPTLTVIRGGRDVED